MATPTVYVLCDQNCKFESMTKEQIFTAIMQAVNDGTIGDIDTGFITTIKTINGLAARFFVGTQADYNALHPSEKRNLFKIITDDTTIDGINQACEDIINAKNEILSIVAQLENGTIKVGSAQSADEAKTLVNNGLTFGRRLVWESTTGGKLVPNDGSETTMLTNSLSGKMLIVEVVAYTADMYGKQFIAKVRSNPFMLKTVTYQGATITGTIQVAVCDAKIEFSIFNDLTIKVRLVEGSGGETANQYYVTALYEEI